MIAKLKNILRWVRSSKSGTGAGQFPIQQIEYSGKVSDAVIIWPFGLFANVPADNLGIMFAVNAQAENRAVLLTAGSRPSLAEGEVALYHPGSGSVIKMAANGDVEITAGTVKITGDAEITGALVVAGRDFATHVHSGVTSGGSNTGPVV